MPAEEASAKALTFQNTHFNVVDQYSGARTSRLSLWRDGAVGPLDEAGTRRSESGNRLNAVGIAVLQGGEDVK